MEEVQIEVKMGLDLGLCLQGHTKWVGDFSTLVGVYKDDNMPLDPSSHRVRENPFLCQYTLKSQDIRKQRGIMMENYKYGRQRSIVP
jgi:hypothetical protein